MIIDHLLKGRAIDQAIAKILYGCGRLAPRVYDLRKRGFQIETTMIPFVNEQGYPGKYAVYSLKKDDETNNQLC